DSGTALPGVSGLSLMAAARLLRGPRRLSISSEQGSRRAVFVSTCQFVAKTFAAVYCATAPDRRGDEAMKAFQLLLFVVIMAGAPFTAAAADDPYAAQLFAQHCAMCHEAGAGGAARIPTVSQLKAMTPGAILKALEGGVMRSQA